MAETEMRNSAREWCPALEVVVIALMELAVKFSQRLSFYEVALLTLPKMITSNLLGNDGVLVVINAMNSWVNSHVINPSKSLAKKGR